MDNRWVPVVVAAIMAVAIIAIAEFLNSTRHEAKKERKGS